MDEIKHLINIDENPFVLFNKWFSEAKEKEINDPNAMNLATVGRDMQPNSRMVLLKSYNSDGFIFYTNINSHKGRMINENDKVALNFYWKSLSKQVRIEGRSKFISNKTSDNYFKTRPLDSKIAAWASNQSSELKNRNELMNVFDSYKKKFEGKEVLRPKHWCGYKVIPDLIEFWQKMPFRLHDRVEFVFYNKKWQGKRLFP